LSGPGTTSFAVLGGGCFWCLEAVFEQVVGVSSVRSGYSGGQLPDPDYRAVCSGTTGHAEVVRVEFDPVAVSFEQLLEIFFSIHDPTTLNRQGNDMGTQYRSVIFPASDEQARIAKGVLKTLDKEGPWRDPIVTAIEPLEVFYPAEDYHDRYFARNGYQPYCAVVIAPKVAAFRRRFSHLLRG